MSINIKIESSDEFEIKGKKYKAVGFGKANFNQPFLSKDNIVYYGPTAGNYLLLKEVLPEWVTPTDEDALRRPICEVRNNEESPWDRAILIGVTNSGKHPFVVQRHGEFSGIYRYCRIRNQKLIQ